METDFMEYLRIDSIVTAVWRGENHIIDKDMQFAELDPNTEIAKLFQIPVRNFTENPDEAATLIPENWTEQVIEQDPGLYTVELTSPSKYRVDSNIYHPADSDNEPLTRYHSLARARCIAALYAYMLINIDFPNGNKLNA